MSETREERLHRELKEAHAAWLEAKEASRAAQIQENVAWKTWNRALGEWQGRERCAEQVWEGFHSHRCSRKRGHGPNGDYCKQHAKRHSEATR